MASLRDVTIQETKIWIVIIVKNFKSRRLQKYYGSANLTAGHSWQGTVSNLKNGKSKVKLSLAGKRLVLIVEFLVQVFYSFSSNGIHLYRITRRAHLNQLELGSSHFRLDFWGINLCGFLRGDFFWHYECLWCCFVSDTDTVFLNILQPVTVNRSENYIPRYD